MERERNEVGYKVKVKTAKAYIRQSETQRNDTYCLKMTFIWGQE